MTELPRRLSTQREFHEALHAAMTAAVVAGCRDLCFCDPDFAAWPLGETAFVEQLQAWSAPRRSLLMLAVHFDDVPRRHPRWLRWRRDHAHLVDCRVVDESDVARLPTLLLAAGVVTLRLFDRTGPRGLLSADSADAVRARELVDAVSQRSAPAFAATTLGL